MPGIISMVPSWTEMLIEADVPLVGRTRFCIEPNEKVKSIQAVGGTKDWNLDAIKALNPDLLVLDKDENPKSMAKSGFPFVATHVHDIPSCIDGIGRIQSEIEKLGLAEPARKLATYQTRWKKLETATPRWKLNHDSWDELPGQMTWINKPTKPIQQICYVIWKNPWMIATRETFIGSIAEKVGLPLSQSGPVIKYPELDIEALDPSNTLLLFSSEPFPFHKKIDELKLLPHASVIVDGQKFSWFGVEALRFLEHSF